MMLMILFKQKLNLWVLQARESPSLYGESITSGPKLLITASVPHEYSSPLSPMAVRGHFDCFAGTEVFVYICYLLETPIL